MFTHYTGNRKFDLQLNRIFSPLLDREDIARIAATEFPRLRSTKEITTLARSLAERFESEGDSDAAWHLHELAAFYLGADDPRKRRFIDAMSASFDEAVVGRARPAWFIDAAMSVAPRFSADLAWKLQQARHLTGLHKPSEALGALYAFTMEPLEGLIHQPCLVLAGDADQDVPFERLDNVRRALRHAESLDVRVFRKAKDPDIAQHCQIGDLDRAFTIIGDWLEGRARFQTETTTRS